ncbi:hypothetical protein BXP70_06635 [Hymenobacter crusticola]|uniref:Uncharacterized protein n=1 Tax=Hymenobacter crusticola TaxID=1770526 RepID=A0A243WFZ2_9BACT|nr:hypothetical protein BXP70_06635 [Hymenobacter crusticola]
MKKLAFYMAALGMLPAFCLADGLPQPNPTRAAKQIVPGKRPMRRFIGLVNDESKGTTKQLEPGGSFVSRPNAMRVLTPAAPASMLIVRPSSSPRDAQAVQSLPQQTFTPVP